MIDDMVALLKQEQLDDDHKKEYCEGQFDLADDKKKELTRAEGKLTASIEDAKESIATLADEIKALEKGIKDLDKTVAEATANRKEENSDFKTLFASDSAAKELLGLAKNRLNKFYNPKLYKAPPARELSDEDRATLAAGGTLAPTAAPGGIAGTGVTVLADVSAHNAAKVAPPPPPATAAAFSKKSEESNGVIAMIDLMIGDLTKEMTEAKTTLCLSPCCFSLCHFFGKIANHQVNHSDHAIRLFRLFREGCCGRWGWWWSHLRGVVRGNVCQNCDASPCNTTWSCCGRQSATCSKCSPIHI
jgi:hypothetical protein